MRKILAVILLLTTIVTLFTACKKDEDETTTQDPLYTVYTPGVSGTTAASNGAASTTQKANAVSPVGSTYVLTTNADKKAPWYSTTRFVPGETTATTTKAVLATTTNSYDDITYTTGTIAPVVATTSSAQSTTWQTTTTTTTAPTTTTTTKATTTKPETTTEEVEPEGVDVTINDMYTNENVLYVSIDSSDWGSKIKSNSGRVDIYVDGVKADKQATIQISSSTNGDGFQSVFVDISKYEVIDYGGTISFTVPEGFLTNSAGTKYNYAFEVTMQG